jgi:hypothetical protein
MAFCRVVVSTDMTQNPADSIRRAATRIRLP